MSLEKELAAQQARAVAQWKETVHACARGGDEPTLAAITKLAVPMGLELVDAVARFRKDVSHVSAYDQACIAAGAAEGRVASSLEPYGSADDFARTVAQAEENARNLREEFDNFTDSIVPAVGRARSQRDALAKARTDLI